LHNECFQKISCLAAVRDEARDLISILLFSRLPNNKL